MNKKLAINGGPATIKEKNNFIWPLINKKIERAVLSQLRKTISIYDRSGIFEEFEEEFAKFHDRKFGLLCNSGTTALHSMYVASGLNEGDEIIFPVYTFFATVTPALFVNIKPIFCDIDDAGNIDPIEIEKKITKKTKAIVVTHMWGVPCDMAKINKIAKKNNLLLFEDCSHAHGATFNGAPVGSFGDMAVWSLQGAKIISGGEGGILLTNNKEFYYKAQLLGHYNKRCKNEIDKNNYLYKYYLTGMGLKYRAHPLAIVIANENFKDIKQILETKRKFVKEIERELKGLPGIRLIPRTNQCNPSWYSFVLMYESSELGGVPIDTFVEALHAEGLIEVDYQGSTMPLNLIPLFNDPAPLFPFYTGKREFCYKKGDFPKAENYYTNTIRFPVWTLNKDLRIMELYVKGIKKVISNYRELL